MPQNRHLYAQTGEILIGAKISTIGQCESLYVTQFSSDKDSIKQATVSAAATIYQQVPKGVAN